MNKLDEFSSKIRWQKEREFKFKNSYRLRDAFKWYRQHRPKDKKYVLTESQYGYIVNFINKRLVENFCKGIPIIFPYKMGELYLYKQEVDLRFNDKGKLINTAPVDWNTTLKVWYDNPEAKEKKLLIKYESKEIFKIRYTKRTARYINQSYVGFRPQRSFKMALHEALLNGKIDGFKKY